MNVRFFARPPIVPSGPTPLDVLQARYDGLERRFDALLEKYHALKVDGAVSVEPLTATAPVPVAVQSAADDMKARIADKCGSNLKLRGIMLRQLAADRAAGLDDDTIRNAIETGYESEGVPL